MPTLAGCHSRIWQGEDWSPCFRRTYLNLLLPLLALSLSALVALAQLLSRAQKARRSALHVARLDPSASSFARLVDHAATGAGGADRRRHRNRDHNARDGGDDDDDDEALGHATPSRRSRRQRPSPGLLARVLGRDEPRYEALPSEPAHADQATQPTPAEDQHSTRRPPRPPPRRRREAASKPHAPSDAALLVYHTENAVILHEVHQTLALEPHALPAPTSGARRSPPPPLERLEVTKRAWEALGSVLLAGSHAAGAMVSDESAWEWAWVALWSYLATLSATSLATRRSFFLHKLVLMLLAFLISVFNFRSALIWPSTSSALAVTYALQLALSALVLVPSLFFPVATKTPPRLRAILQTMRARKAYGEAGTAIPSPRRLSTPPEGGFGGEEEGDGNDGDLPQRPRDVEEEAAAVGEHMQGVRRFGDTPSAAIAHVSTATAGIEAPATSTSTAPAIQPSDGREPPRATDASGGGGGAAAAPAPALLLPAPEARASIVSRAFFGFVTPYLVKHAKVQFTLPAVPDLPGPDHAACVVADFRASSSPAATAAARTHAGRTGYYGEEGDEEGEAAVEGPPPEERLMPSDRPLVLRLFRYFAPLLAVQFVWAVVEATATLTPPVGMRLVLGYIAERDEAKRRAGGDTARPETPFHMAVLFVLLMALGQQVTSVASSQALFIGRRVCIRLRAILVFEIVNKALRRRDTGAAAAAAATGVAGGEGGEVETHDPKNPYAAPARRRRRARGGDIGKSGEVKENSGGKRAAAAAAAADSNGDADADVSSGSSSGLDGGVGEAEAEAESEGGTGGRATDGEVTNLVSVDVFKVSEIGAYLHYCFPSAPLQIALAVALLVELLGWSAVVGLTVLLLSFPVQMATARLFIRVQKLILEASDRRLNLTTEVLNCIKTVKFFAWESSFERRLDETRQVELRMLKYRFGAWLLGALAFVGVPIVVTIVTFAFHTRVLHRPLPAETAFTALALFNTLRRPLDMLPDMIANILSSLVSIRRIDAYLHEAETEKYEQLLGAAKERTADDPVVGFRDATFTYVEDDTADHNGAPNRFCLRDVNLRFPEGELSVVAGPVGSGKTTLLLSLLGETRQLCGRTFMPCAVARTLLERDPVTGLSESVAYCSQSPWLLGATVRENVLFGMPYEERRYRAVLRACALEADLEVLEYHDETEVGEKGTSLSGGQKARLALARALYSPARYLLVDDALSAVDAHTAKHLYRHYFRGALMRGRTCVLVTHAVGLCAPGAAFLVALDEGKVVASGTPREVLATGLFDEEVGTTANATPASSRAGDVDGAAEASTDSEADRRDDDDVAAAALVEEEPDEATRAAQALEARRRSEKKAAHSREETYGKGSQSLRAYTLYCRSFAASKLSLAAFWVVIVFFFLGARSMDVLTAAWLRKWVASYAGVADDGDGGATGQARAVETSSSDAPIHVSSAFALAYAPVVRSTQLLRSAAPSLLPLVEAMALPVQRLLSPRAATATDAFAAATEPSQVVLSGSASTSAAEDRTVHFLGVYVVLALFYIAFFVLRDAASMWGSLQASRNLYRRLMKSVMLARPQWFDRTPVGRIMNRLSKDMETVDQEIALQLIFFFDVSVQSAVILGISCYAVPAFIPAAVGVIGAYWAIGALYVVSSRDLKRIESVTRSPIFGLVGEVLSGAVLIRAYGDASRFTRHCLRLVDKTNRPFFFLWYENRWLSVRVEAVATVVMAGIALFLVSTTSVDAALAGFTMSFTAQLVDSVLWVLRCYTLVEINANSVERIAEYLEVEPERQEGREPPAAWPSPHGGIEVESLSVRYTSEFPRVLKDVSFRVRAGQKVGIVGRTGSGKSTLALAFFRFLEAEAGRIVIDGIDISTVPLKTLRERLTVIPQDAQLFSGTVRSNLDPFGRFGDEELWTALRQCQLAPPTPRGTTAEGGEEDFDAGEDQDDDAALPAPPGSHVVTSLDMAVEPNGRNFSAGQKQLLALARGLLKLRGSHVLILDESTANLDAASDAHIQRTLRRQLASTKGGSARRRRGVGHGGDGASAETPSPGTTLLTIAHRLRTIADYDRVLVLSAGEVAEFGAPHELLARPGGAYRELAQRSGEWDVVAALAEVQRRREEEAEASVGELGRETKKT